MIDQLSLDIVLQRVDALGREVRQLRRDLLRGVANQSAQSVRKQSLFGSVKAEDITEAMIEAAKQELFRPLNDL